MFQRNILFPSSGLKMDTLFEGEICISKCWANVDISSTPNLSSSCWQVKVSNIGAYFNTAFRHMQRW
jgi:hypothetical protein